MAERQAAFQYNRAAIDELVKQLSGPRMAPYRKRSNMRDELAIELYLYNARLSRAFLFPLHILEVVLRNAIDTQLTIAFGSNWHLNPNFSSALQKEGQEALKKAIKRSTSKGQSNKNDVVANLSFDFWSNILKDAYDLSLWPHGIGGLLPYSSICRIDFHRDIAEINRLRNRIAHHEPILSEDLSGLHKKLLDCIRARSPITADWVRCHSLVQQMMRTRPSTSGAQGPSVGDRCDTSLRRAQAKSLIKDCREDLMNDLIVENADATLLAMLGPDDLGKYLLKCADESGLIDLGEHSLSQVVKELDATRLHTTVAEDVEIIALRDILKKPLKYAIVNAKGLPDKIIGFIKTAHRRY